MKSLKLPVVLVCVACLVGCAQVPPQSVELSATLGRDLLELQRSHRKAIDLLHDRDVEQINRYVDQVVVPTYVKTVMDVLRNEKPLFFGFIESTKVGYVATHNEPVGEGDDKS